MTPERWRHVTAIFHAALARAPDGQATFLAEACGEDATLRREVEAMLAAHRNAGRFGDTSMLAFAGEGRRFEPGTSFGPYRIDTLIAAGGMGEVYRARDPSLGRDVAIKMLPRAFSSDPERLERFEREARMLAALNHPHIGVIYGLEEADGVRGLVLELVEGPTLADRLQGGPLPVSDALTIARQIADALDAAHEKGIVHRDLKPANVKITPEGTVKVLDFGLAKVAIGDASGTDLTAAPTVTLGGTREGLIVGTAAYMSPEQARGQAVDKRTDIWAFGCVLYEMLTGRTAFPGQTITDTLAAILEREPGWSALPNSTPVSIRRLLQRCLEKDAKRRLRDIGDARMEIEEVLAAPAAGRGHEGARNSSPRAVRWIAGLLAVAAIVIIAALAGARFARPSAPNTLSGGSIEPLTRDSGLTTMPAVSPDGKLIAYASDRAGRGDFDIWVQQTAGGTPLRVTDDPADDQMPDFSPDSSELAFRSERSNGGVFIVPALGGNARLVAPDGRAPRFSPDGARLAYWSGLWRGTPSVLASTVSVLSLSGGAPQRVLADFSMARDPVWAPDGRSLLVLARRDGTSSLADAFDWWWVPLDGRPPVKSGLLDVLDLRRETDQGVVTLGAWSESGALVAIRGSVWLIPLSLGSGHVNGAPRQLTLGAGRFIYPTIGRDGQVAFAVMDSARVVERVSLGRDTEFPSTLYSDNGNDGGRPSETADGSTIVFEQSFGQAREVWLRSTRSGQQRMVLRVDSALAIDAVISPDGSRIGYTVGQTVDKGTGYVVDAAGGVPMKICDDCGVHGFLSDNRRVLVVNNGFHTIRVVNVMTGIGEDAMTVTENRIARPHASPDDHWLAFGIEKDAIAKSYVTRLKPGSPPPSSAWHQVEEPTTTGRPAGWSPDSSVLYLLLDTDGFRCLWGQQVDPVAGSLNGGVFVARHLHYLGPVGGPSTSFGNPVTRDGFLYGVIRPRSNIWRGFLAKPSS